MSQPLVHVRPQDARWTLELLAGKLDRITEHAVISRETVRRRVTESELKPWRKDMWCIPQIDADYVAGNGRRARSLCRNAPSASGSFSTSIHPLAPSIPRSLPADEAPRLPRGLEFHYVPKHAGWLNIVEIEIGVLAAECLDRRIDSIAQLAPPASKSATHPAPASSGCSQKTRLAPR